MKSGYMLNQTQQISFNNRPRDEETPAVTQVKQKQEKKKFRVREN